MSKFKLVANLVRGYKANDAINQLNNTNKKAASLLVPLIRSAVANAINNNKLDVNTLMVTNILLGPGVTYKRGRFGPKGRINKILKRTTNVKVVVAGEAIKSDSLGKRRDK